MNKTPRAIARRILRPLFDRPITPEQRRVCDAVTDLVESLPAEEREFLDMPDVGRERLDHEDDSGHAHTDAEVDHFPPSSRDGT